MIDAGVFFGTPPFAASCLQVLIDKGVSPRLVVTQPDRPAGRNRKLHQSAVKQLALTHSIAVAQPEHLDDASPELIRQLSSSDCAIVVAYGSLLPQNILSLPEYGCLNVHASLLPRWRGAAPVQRAILAGDTITGVSIMQMDAGLDTGDVLAMREYAMSNTHTGGSLTSELADLGAELLLEVIANYHNRQPTPQSAEGVTYARKFSRQEAKINWQDSAVAIARQVRAFHPVPVCWSVFDGLRIKLWQAQVITDNGKQAAPGTLVDASPQGLDIACGRDGRELVRIQQIQLPGAQVKPVAVILQSRSPLFQPGACFA